MKLPTLLLVLWTTMYSLSAQVQRIASFPAGGDIVYQQFEDKFLLVSTAGAWTLDPERRLVDSLMRAQWRLDGIRLNSTGAYCYSFAYDNTGNSGFHRLYHIDHDGTVFTSPVINQSQYPSRKQPQYPRLSQDRYYISGHIDGLYKVWESDATEAGTRVIFESEEAILDIATLNDQVLILAQSELAYEFLRYTYQDSLTLFASFPKAEYVSPSLRVIGEDDTFLYVNMNDSSGREAIWRTDLSSMGTSAFLEGYNAHKIQFIGERFYLQTGTGWETNYLIGFMDVSELIDTLHFAPPYDTPSQRIIKEIGPGIFRCASYEFGVELGYLNDDNQIQLYQDLATGASSSILCRLYSSRSSCYSDDNYLIDNGMVYTLLSNGNDPFYYLYEMSEEGNRSLLRTEDPFNFQYPFIHDGNLYWFEDSASYKIMKSYQIDQGSQDIQPDTPEDPDVWIRQMMIAYANTPFQAYSNFYLLPRGVEIGTDGSIYMGFWDNSWTAPTKKIYFSDTTAYASMSGTNVYAKYDSHGNLLWHTSVGSPELRSGYHSTFAIDHDDNMVTVGTYKRRAYFDQDTLITDNAGVYLAKLDGKTGRVLWTRELAQTFYTNTIEIEKNLAFDRDNNIYLSFLYRELQLEFDGIWLSSDRNPTNALASYDPEGNLRWGKNITTPWTDRYGETRVLEMNAADQTLMVAQSQGSYNVSSSCEFREWRYFFQRYDVDGSLLDTFQMKGSDLGGLVDGTYTDNGRFVGVGFHRGTLDLGRFSTRSPREDDCHQTVGFFFEYAPDWSEITYAGAFNEVDFKPFAMRSYRGHTYKLGTRQGRAILLKYTDQGAFIGAKALNQRASVFREESHVYFDVKDGYIVVQGGNFEYDAEARISPMLFTEQIISLLRIEDRDWNIEEEGYDLVELEPELEDNEFRVYPNPFDRSIRVQLSEKAARSTQYDIFTIQGQRLQHGALTEDKIQEIVLPELAAGIYLLRLSGGDEVFSEKIVKY